MNSRKEISPRILWMAQTGLISAAAVVLSAFEGMLPDLPVPVPGAKLGLSNIAVMSAADCLGLPSALTAACFKAVFAGLTRGGTAFLMSLAGGLLSTLVMYLFLAAKTNRFGYIGIAVCGAAVHNTAQLCVAALLADASIFAYLPVLLLAAVLAGCLTGLAMGLIVPPVKKLKLYGRMSG